MTIDAFPLSFLFTDIEGSSLLWEAHPEEMESALSVHDEIINREVSATGGTVVKGTGDGFMAVFPAPEAAVEAAVATQLALSGTAFEGIEQMPVRIGIHIGEAQPRAGDYYGTAVNRAARLMSIGHGGQILVSSALNDFVGDRLPSPLALHSLGEHRLRDLTAPEQVYQLEHPDLRTEFPPLDSLDAFANNLPSMVDSFVGRVDDLVRVTDTIADARLVTLTGTGGTGKTRLAVEAAARSIDGFPWGAWLVNLAPLADPAAVPSAIAAAIGIEPQPGRSVVDTLISRLADRGMLIVLDNCDHLLDASADTAHRLLEQCPTLKILATSRQRLGVSGEHVLIVSPLSYPETIEIGPDDVPDYEAMQLFADRAREASMDWALDPESAPHVARICAAVDGLPLAIELAAARTRVLTVAQIADRLDQQLALLGGSTRGDDRHRALKATIDWSYDTMTDDEQRLFRCLGVFRGGADFEAIEAVCAEGMEAFVLDALDGLVTKSMIIAGETSRGMRYRLLEPLRQYATIRLQEHGEEAEAFASHWEWFDRFAGEVSRGVRSDEQLEWLARTEVEYDNLRVAMARAYDAEEIETCVSLVGSLSWFMFLHSHVEDWELWLPRLLEHQEVADQRNLARLRLSASQYSWELSRMEEAAGHAKQVLEIADTVNSDTLRAWAHTYLALIGTLGVDLEAVEEHLDIANGLFQARGNPAGIGNVLWLRSFLSLLQHDLGVTASAGDLDELWESMEVVVEGARQSGDRNLLGHTLWTSAWAARLRGDLDRAQIQSAEGTQALYELGNHYCLSHNLLFAGHIAMMDDEPEKAATLLSASHSIKERLGVTGSPLDQEFAGRLRASIELVMDQTTLNEAWEEGQRLAVATAVGLATI